VALPDFLVAGVPKAGTTALHMALSRHPGLYMSPIKEPKFFLTDGPPPTKGGPGDALTYREHVWQRDRYEALFDAAPAGALCGESTPLYLHDRAALRRIKELTPAARLIVVLRDPVERAHSNWTHLWSAGLEPVGDFVRACAEEERRVAAGWASFWHYIGLGKYGEQLDYAFSQFPREQVLVRGTACWWTSRPSRSTGSAPFSVSPRASSPRSPGRTSPATRSTRWGTAPRRSSCGRATRPGA